MPATIALQSGPPRRAARQTADPAVTHLKFERELARFRELERHYQERGILLRRVEFPQLFFIFVASRLRPAPILFGAKFDFTNYDVEAIGLEFVDALTEVPLRLDQLPTNFPRQAPPVAMEVSQADGSIATQLVPVQPQALLQAHPPHQIPFLCLPGVREYHDHAAHSNDPWPPHRDQGEGTLGFLLDQFYRYGTAPPVAYLPNLVPGPVNEQGQPQMEMRGVSLLLNPAS